MALVKAKTTTSKHPFAQKICILPTTSQLVSADLSCPLQGRGESKGGKKSSHPEMAETLCRRLD